MHTITLKATPGSSRTTTAVSDQLFRVSGRGVANPTFRHEIRRFTGKCCQVEGKHLHLSAVPGVISAKPQPKVETLDVAIDDLITVDGQVYQVSARRMGDPILWPYTDPGQWLQDLATDAEGFLLATPATQA